MAYNMVGGRFREFNASGAPLAGGKVYTSNAGQPFEASPLATYTTQAGDVANTNPVILDSSGRAAIWVGESAYRVKVTDADDVIMYEEDHFQLGGLLGASTLMTANIAITATSVRLDFPPSKYLATLPVVLVTVLNNLVTQVDVSSTLEVVEGYGEVYSHVDLTFQAGAVGSRANVWVAS